MFKYLIVLFLGLSVLVLLGGGPLVSFAQTAGGASPTAVGVSPPTSFINPLNAATFTQLFVGIANWLAGIVGVVAVLMIVIGGLQYIFSGGSEEKTKQARRTIFWAVIGLIIVLSAWSLLQAVASILGIP